MHRAFVEAFNEALRQARPRCFMTHTGRFSHPRQSPRRAHPAGDQRKISGDLVVHYKRRLYCIEPSADEAKRLARKQCTVLEWLDGTIELRCEGQTLPFTCFDKDWRDNPNARGAQQAPGRFSSMGY